MVCGSGDVGDAAVSCCVLAVGFNGSGASDVAVCWLFVLVTVVCVFTEGVMLKGALRFTVAGLAVRRHALVVVEGVGMLEMLP